MERASRQCGAAARLSVFKRRKGILGVSVYRASIFADTVKSYAQIRLQSLAE